MGITPPYGNGAIPSDMCLSIHLSTRPFWNIYMIGLSKDMEIEELLNSEESIWWEINGKVHTDRTLKWLLVYPMKKKA